MKGAAREVGARARRGPPLCRQFRLRGKDGTYRWFVGRALPQRAADGTNRALDRNDDRRPRPASGPALRTRISAAGFGDLVLGRSIWTPRSRRSLRSRFPRLADWCQIHLRTRRRPHQDGRDYAYRDPEGDRDRPAVRRADPFQPRERETAAPTFSEPGIGAARRRRGSRNRGSHRSPTTKEARIYLRVGRAFVYLRAAGGGRPQC